MSSASLNSTITIQKREDNYLSFFKNVFEHEKHTVAHTVVCNVKLTYQMPLCLVKSQIFLLPHAETEFHPQNMGCFHWFYLDQLPPTVKGVGVSELEEKRNRTIKKQQDVLLGFRCSSSVRTNSEDFNLFQIKEVNNTQRGLFQCKKQNYPTHTLIALIDEFEAALLKKCFGFCFVLLL